MIKRLTGPFKVFGLFPGFLYCIHRALAKISPDLGIFYYELMAQPVLDESVLPPKFSQSFEISEIKRTDPLAKELPLTSETLAFRFDQKSVCLGARQKEDFIGYMWLCMESYDEDEVRCTFVPNSDEGVWDFGLYLFPEHRFGPGFIALWDGANEYLRNAGYRYTFSRVSWFNLNSRKVHKYFKWRRIGQTVFLKLKSWQIMVGTVAPYIHVSMTRNSKPTIRVQAPA